MKYIIPILAALIALCSCSGVKNLAPARTDIPETYEPGNTADTVSIADIAWWEFYSDSTLRKIILATLENNHDLLKSAAKIEEMRRLYGVDKANILPEISALGSADNETNNYGGRGTTSDAEYDLKIPVAWEINLWGALTWAKKRGAANFKASIEDYRAMQMTLISEAASAYFRLIALDNELTIVKQTLDTREQSLEQARLRFEGGLTSETVYQQAKVEYASTASLVPDLEHKITAARNALTLLMGEYPRQELQRDNLVLNSILPEKLPAGIPSELLRRRPDIRAAAQKLQAAMANAGYTYADRFPRLRIGVTAGWENDELKDFFKSPFSYVIGAITGPVFDFGRRKNKYKAAVAAYEQSRLTYEKTVMQAFTEVNTALSAYRRVKETSALKIELRDAAVKYVQLAHLQYRGGTLNYIEVLDAQRRYFDAQIGVSNAVRDEHLALINLYKALGGGWELPATDAIADSQPNT